jgi:hypothetical protein
MSFTRRALPSRGSNRLERDIPAGKLVHVILDNYGSHTHPKVRAWLARHPCWTFDFTRTSASWLNTVKGFFAKLTRRPFKEDREGGADRIAALPRLRDRKFVDSPLEGFEPSVPHQKDNALRDSPST